MPPLAPAVLARAATGGEKTDRRRPRWRFPLPFFAENEKTFELTLDSQTDLVGHVSDLANGVRQVVVLFEEIEGAEREQLKGDAHVTVVVEPVVHLHAQAARQTARAHARTSMLDHRWRHRASEPRLTIYFRGPSR